MGKVKVITLLDWLIYSIKKVSIPYGKGKVIRAYEGEAKLVKYQFPMGKVKRCSTL